MIEQQKQNSNNTEAKTLEESSSTPKNSIMKHWHLVHINTNLAEFFQNSPILPFRQNKNLRDIIGTKLIKNIKVKRKFTNKIQGKYTPCLTNNRTMCCKQVLHTTTFRSN